MARERSKLDLMITAIHEAGGRGAHILRPSAILQGGKETQTDVIFYPKDDKHISIGSRFSDLKDRQRCSASEPATAR
jgi:hypothetical protein